MGCLKLTKRSQPLVGRSSRYCGTCGGDIAAWQFFPVIDTCLSCEDIARQSCAMVPRWRFFGDFWVLHFQRTTCSTFQTCIKIRTRAEGHTMCMVDIQSPTAEIRRGKKERKKKKKTTWQKYNGLPYYIGRPWKSVCSKIWVNAVE